MMKEVTYEDEQGYRWIALLRDTDPDDQPEIGVPLSPPDLDLLDWEAIKRDLHNALLDRRLFTLRDVSLAQRGVSSAIQQVLKSRIVHLYKQQEHDRQGG